MRKVGKLDCEMVVMKVMLLVFQTVDLLVLMMVLWRVVKMGLWWVDLMVVL